METVEQIRLTDGEKEDLMNEVAVTVAAELTTFTRKTYAALALERGGGHVMVDVDWVILGAFSGLMHMILTHGGGKAGLDNMRNLYKIADETFGPALLTQYAAQKGTA